MKKTILAVDDSSMTEFPEFTLLEVDDLVVNPTDVAASALGFATDISYVNYFKDYGVKLIGASDEFSTNDLYDIWEDLEDRYSEPTLEDFISTVYGVEPDIVYDLSELGYEYD